METIQQAPKKTQKLKLDFKDSKYATGRRKTSIAKIWLKKGSGKIYVNGKNFQNYFPNENHQKQVVKPFEVINQATDYDVRCNVMGGGHTGQAGAMVHGISKALLLFDADGWYTSWESPPHYSLAETWDVQVVRVDEFTFSH